MKAFFLPAVILLVGCHSTPKAPPTAETMDKGRQLFTQHCQQCHPNGKASLGPALNNKPAPAFLIKTQIRWGLGAMPSFNKQEIPPPDLEALVTYVIALRKEGTKPTPK